LVQAAISCFSPPWGQGTQLNVGLARQGAAQGIKRITLVGFHRDDRPFWFKEFHQNTQPADNFFGRFQHNPVVGGNIRFAFGPVDNDGVAPSAGGPDFIMGGKRRAAEPHNARVPYDMQQLFGGQGLDRPIRPYTRVEAVFPVVLQNDGFHKPPVGVRTQLNRLHISRNRGMDGGGYRFFRVGYKLPHMYRLPVMHRRPAGDADVHRQREDQLFQSSDRLNFFMAGLFLFLVGEDPAPKPSRHRLSLPNPWFFARGKIALLLL
jgi:hypothetical protein